MTKRVLASLGFLLAGAALAHGQGCGEAPCVACGKVLPPVKIPPVATIRAEIEPLKESPPVALPGVDYFRAAVAPPKFTACPPQPPLKYFRCPPPEVVAFKCPPPAVNYFRAEASCPTPPVVCKQPPITVFRATTECPRPTPPVQCSGVTVLAKPQPGCPVQVPCPCAPGGAN